MKQHSFKKIALIAGRICLCLLTVLAIVALFSAGWYENIYGDLGFDSILFTLTANRDGVSHGLIGSWIVQVVPATLLLSVAALLFFNYRSQKPVIMNIGKRAFQLFPLQRWVSAALCLVFCCCLFLGAANAVGLSDYLQNRHTYSDLYEQEYRDPKETAITFPEQKRNLIYIYLESMETSFLSTEQGGLLPYNAIPELTALAEENINFSHNTKVGGFSVVPGTSWTIGAMVAQTAGIPLKVPADIEPDGYGSDGVFLPGITSLTDILKENGYYQTLMVGSDSAFGGRKAYYEMHGVDKIYDLYTARQDGIIPEDYEVWWGYEDLHLFEYAKQELVKIAAQEQPFAFTMLTVDTHHIGGYVCSQCENTYEEQYENVYACSSKQVAAFVAWLQQQDFYENTTIVITGDHASMDNSYFERVGFEGYERHIYNCFINSAVTAENTQNRAFCAFDMLPTTLRAMGCAIEGDQLGLGTNLFSRVPTLMESHGQTFLDEVAQNSQYYNERFFLEFE